MIRNPLFIIGLILVLMPIAIKIFIEIRPLPLSDSNDSLQYFVKKFELSIAHSDAKQSLDKPYLIHYESFINVRSVNNSLDLPRGSVKASMIYNCSKQKHFFENFSYFKYNDFTHNSYDNSYYLRSNFESTQNKYTQLIKNIENFHKIYEDICPLFSEEYVIHSNFQFKANNEAEEIVHPKPGRFGMRWEAVKEGIKVVEAIKNSPADLVGLSKGDVIIEINGISFKDSHYTNNEILTTGSLINGFSGSTAALKVLKAKSNEIYDITLVRDEAIETKYFINLDGIKGNLLNFEDNTIEISCSPPKLFPYDKFLINLSKPIIIKAIRQIKGEGQIVDSPLITYPVKDHQLRLINTNNFEQALPICNVTHMPKFIKPKIILFSQNFVFH